MWLLCPECNIEGGCDCFPPTGRKYQPIDHEKELEQHKSDLISEALLEIKKRK